MAQVTIGLGEKPARAALLDLKTEEPNSNNATSDKGGLLLPRVELEELISLRPFIPDEELSTEAKKHVGLTVYNITPVPLQNIEKGIYVWDGIRWNASTVKSGTFFYLPSFDLDISSIGPKTKKLYDDVYAKQFQKAGNNTFVSSDNTLNQVTTILSANKFDYIVTEYSDDVITVDSIIVMVHYIIQ